MTGPEKQNTLAQKDTDPRCGVLNCRHHKMMFLEQHNPAYWQMTNFTFSLRNAPCKLKLDSFQSTSNSCATWTIKIPPSFFFALFHWTRQKHMSCALQDEVWCLVLDLPWNVHKFIRPAHEFELSLSKLLPTLYSAPTFFPTVSSSIFPLISFIFPCFPFKMCSPSGSSSKHPSHVSFTTHSLLPHWNVNPVLLHNRKPVALSQVAL